MKRIAGAVFRILAYLVVFLLVTVGIMGLTKTFLGDWEAGGVSLELLLGAYFRTMGPLALGLLSAALAEEWLFRGYPLTALAGVAGRGWANLALALLFAAAHLGSSGYNGVRDLPVPLGR